MKTLRYILFSLLIVVCLGLLCYQYITQGYLETNQITRAGLIIIGAVLSMLRKPRNNTVNKKATYAKAYEEYIQGAFQDSPKLEKKLFAAIHLYNLSKPHKAVAKLEQLQKECQNTNERRAVASFLALCLDDMQLYEQAISQYQAAIHMQNNTSLLSNMGLCYQKSGDFETAEDCYQEAIQTDPKNCYALNNLSALHFRQGDYRKSLDLAEAAVKIEQNMRPALTTAAVCCGMLGDTEKYEQYYRKAVANGVDGSTIKEILRNMNSEL